MLKAHEILDAPCCFCGYNGSDYYKPHTHKPECPFYEIGGAYEREHALVAWAKKGMLKIDGYPKHASQSITGKQTQCIHFYKTSCKSIGTACDGPFCRHYCPAP